MARALIEQYIKDATAALERMSEAHVAQIEAAAQAIAACLRRGGTVHVCGNGGSAADAQHIAAELAGRYLRERRGLACHALSTNTSTITAVGNDYGYEQVFARQVEAYARAGDVLWCLSTSGNSSNIVAAAKAARLAGVRVVTFTGGDGGQLVEHSDIVFVAPAEGSYAVQQLHQVAYHAVCDIVEQQAT